MKAFTVCIMMAILASSQVSAGRVGYDPRNGSFIEIDGERPRRERAGRIDRREKPVWSDEDGQFRYEHVLRDDGRSIETFDHDRDEYRIYHMIPNDRKQRPRRPMR